MSETVDSDAQVYRPQVNEELVRQASAMLLEGIGVDLSAEEFLDTPNRITRFWKEFIDYDPGNLETTFEAIQADQMVVVRGIKGFSLCSHHLLPFIFEATVGYITGDRIIGLSKLARVVHKHAHKPQVQERLAYDIALEIEDLTKSRGVGVVIKGVHLCMQMRGIRSQGEMISSVLRGVMYDRPQVRAEFLSLAQGGSNGYITLG